MSSRGTIINSNSTRIVYLLSFFIVSTNLSDFHVKYFRMHNCIFILFFLQYVSFNSEIANFLDKVLWHVVFVNIEWDMGSFGLFISILELYHSIYASPSSLKFWVPFFPYVFYW